MSQIVNNQSNNSNNKFYTQSSKRFYEIDVIKGIAVVLMVYFHFYYLQHFMNIKHHNVNSGFLNYSAKIAHTIFILMVGVNLAVNYQKSIKEKQDYNCYFGKQMKRAIFLLATGMIFSYLSYLGFDQMYVKFGILHFIAVAIVISQILVHNKFLSLLGALVVLLISLIISNLGSQLDFSKCHQFPMTCFISGIYNVKYNSLDHFPLIPYLFYVFIGIFIGHILYNKFKRNFDEQLLERFKNNKLLKLIAVLGKYSFLIYIIHFPLFYFILSFFR